MFKHALLLAFVVVMLACNNKKAEYDYDAMQKYIDSIPPDTSHYELITGYKGKAYPLFFEAVYDSGTTVKKGRETYAFSTYDAGMIKIESGKIIASDAYFTFDATVIAQKFPIGQFPVQLAMAKAFNDTRVAFSRILFSNAEVAKWEFALTHGEKPIAINDTSFYCYPVDSGTGIFIDSTANAAFLLKDPSVWQDVFLHGLERSGYKGFTHNFEGHNLTTFSSGYGDGCYATFIGFDKQGNVCRLLTDFDIVNRREF